LTRHTRNLGVITALAIGIAVAIGVGRRPKSPSETTSVRSSVERGGEIVVSLRSEPQSFNWFVRHDMSTYIVTVLTQGKLVRIDRVTDEVEPWLAESWSRSEDGLRYTINLQRGVTFADGEPFTADDVVFSFAAAYDEKGGSALADSFRIAGGKLRAEAVDPHTVVVTFPAPFGPGLRLLDNLPIIPRHKLELAVRERGIGSTWGLSTPVGDITGLGPFVLSEYASGQRMVFTRNPRYFRKDANGTAMPYLDRILIEIVPDQNAQTLRLDAGQSDMPAFEIAPEDYAPLKRAADAGRVQLFDLGVGPDPDGLWFNLKPGAFANDPRAAWIQRDELRHAISLAVDRQIFADTVFLGAGVPVFGPVTPANKKWYSPDVPQTPHDPARAVALLRSIGLADRNGDGVLDDARGAAARFTLMAQKGQTAHERGAAVIRDELKKIGLIVDVAMLEGNALVQRFVSGRQYDAMYFKLITSDADPALNLDYWLSSGGARVWNLGQKTPATPWEKEIDELMARQIATLDEGERKALFAQVQKIFAAHLPIVHFVVPRTFVAASARVMNLTPAIQRPQLLWSPDTIAVRH
jgi:peptide/nickel transport system substrate-binding protein